jgi:transcriptional regulator with GAF, ATPase, and Fis domain
MTRGDQLRDAASRMDQIAGWCRSNAPAGEDFYARQIRDLMARATECDTWSDALASHGGSVAEAAAALGVSEKEATRTVGRLGLQDLARRDAGAP